VNFRGINRELPLLMHVEVKILSNITDLGQSQKQAKSSYNYSLQHAGEYWHDFELWLLQIPTDSSLERDIPTLTMLLDKATLRRLHISAVAQ